MDDQAVVSECARYGCPSVLGDSEDSDEEFIPEPLLAQCWEDHSILGRLGLSSCEQMIEEEVEGAFGQFAMAFHCDQYTLTQRLQAEKHDRTVAQENLQLELQTTRDALQVLCGRVPSDEVRERVRQMEESLQILESSLENIISAAETLGATHQEARVSHAAELMILHVDHLKKRHSLENTELLDTRKLLQRSRLLSDATEDGEVKLLGGDSRQLVTRRRVSMTLLPTQAQLTDLEVKFVENCRSGEELDSQIQEVSNLRSDRRIVVLPVGGSVDAPKQPTNEESTDGQEEDMVSDSFPRPLQVNLRARRPHALLKCDQSSEGEESSTAEWSQDPIDDVLPEPFICTLRRTLLSWLPHSRSTLMVLLVVCGTLLLLFNLLLHFRATRNRTFI